MSRMPSPVKFPGLSKVDQDRVEEVGIDLGMTNRCGSYLQMDQDIVQSECSQQGIEVLSFKKAMEKYDGMKEYTWQAVSPEKDDITRYVAAQKEPKGYVIIAHKGSNNILPIQACLYLGREEIQHVHKGRTHNPANMVYAFGQQGLDNRLTGRHFYLFHLL